MVKAVEFIFNFNQQGDFEAMCAAESFLRERGLSVGSSQRGYPRGIMFGEYDIAKWRNLRDFEKAALHGIMISYGDSMRNGPINVTIFATAPAEARAALSQATQGQQP